MGTGRRPGRPTIYEEAMTPTERQRRWRAKKEAEIRAESSVAPGPRRYRRDDSVKRLGMEAFLAANVAPPAAVITDGWQGYAGLCAAGYAHDAINLSRTWGDAVLRLPAIHLVFGLAKRWLLGTHHGAVGQKHLQAYLDEYHVGFDAMRPQPAR